MSRTPPSPPTLSEPVSALRAWAAALRPPSLLVAVAPVLVGTALVYHQSGEVDWAFVALALLAALLMQVITNLQNDVGYTTRGAETVGQRTGLPRATALGWLSVRQVRVAIALLCALALAVGLGLVYLRGWPVLLLGGSALLAALAYMGGPRPIAYTPWGETTAFVFFGPVAVLGTGWLLQVDLGANGALASVAIGCLAAAALAVNNHRDIAHDRLAGRTTFAVRFGAATSRRALAGWLALPFLLLTAMAWRSAALWPLLPLLLAPLAWRLYRDFAALTDGPAFNAILFRTFRLGLWFSLLLSLGALLDR